MSTETNTKKNLTVQLKLQDYGTWRPGYDGREQGRLAAGITNGKVYRSAEDPNDVVILSDVSDVAKARSFLGSEDLKMAMQKSGVQGSPTIRFAA